MVTIRLANEEDFELFYSIKAEDLNIFWAGWSTKPDKEKLRAFFLDAVEHAGEKDTRKIYIVENEDKERVGYIYILPNGEEFEVPCSILSKYNSRGYGRQAISLGLKEGKKLGFKKMVTSIREDNIASLKAYTSCGVKVREDYKDYYIPRLGKNVKMFYVEYDFDDKTE